MKSPVYRLNFTESCHIKKEKQNNFFVDLARKSKFSMGFFFGLKLYIIINDKGDLMALKITIGNIDDRKPVPSPTK